LELVGFESSAAFRLSPGFPIFEGPKSDSDVADVVATMELSWLEDFLELAECGNFSRVAERRGTTQPAFSRRIKALEDWVGAELINRDTHRIALTAAGDRFRQVADETIRRLRLGREEVRETAATAASTLRFAATHVLSMTFFPVWLRALQERGKLDMAVRLTADNMQACEKLMLQGQAQFLLCHHHPAAATALDPTHFKSLPLDEDVLLPVSAPAEDGLGALCALPGTPECPVQHLAYTVESGIGRIVAAILAGGGTPAHLTPSFASHAAMVLAAMARDRRGVAWLPLSLVQADLQSGSLLRAGDETWDIPIEIRLYRPRARQAQAAEAFWSLLSE
jgi:LysR family transcriptional regulator, hypochlorite-specific transcription factor HypT